MSRIWLVRKSRFPFAALGEELGTVVARDYESATAVASCSFKRPFTIEPAPRERAPMPELAEIPARAPRRRPQINLLPIVPTNKTPKRARKCE
jgi:hypothetical protein